MKKARTLLAFLLDLREKESPNTSVVDLLSTSRMYRVTLLTDQKVQIQ